jgi:small subunit ribosomal protein S21|tara:strand:- start:1319 stop:1504 length:186 start_codon:yes stop_codon:yes gene_type:complete
MIKIKVNEKNIEKALKEYKLKFKRIKVKEELINRKNFTKPSEEEREEKQKAIYIRKKNEES